MKIEQTLSPHEVRDLLDLYDELVDDVALLRVPCALARLIAMHHIARVNHRGIPTTEARGETFADLADALRAMGSAYLSLQDSGVPYGGQLRVMRGDRVIENSFQLLAQLSSGEALSPPEYVTPLAFPDR